MATTTDPSIVDHTEPMGARKRIALVAHDYRKRDLIHWAASHREALSRHDLYGTGTTGTPIEQEAGLQVHRFKSGPLGGDLQIGAAIAENRIDILIFFWDPLQAQPHDVDVKALLRIAVVYNIPVACSRSSADFMISSQLMDSTYNRYIVDYSTRYSEPGA